MRGRIFSTSFVARGVGLGGAVVGGQDAEGEGVGGGEAVAVEAEADFALERGGEG